LRIIIQVLKISWLKSVINIYMNINSIIVELDEVIEKLKVKILMYEQENKLLRKRIKELKQFVMNN